MRVPWPAARTTIASVVFSVMLRRQDSNLDLTAPKAVVLPLHHGGPRPPELRAASSLPDWPRLKSAMPQLAVTPVRAIRPPAATSSARYWTMSIGEETDEVDRIVAAWNPQRPDLDFSPLEVLSRVDRLSRQLDRARRDVFRRSDLEPWEWDVLSALRRAGEPFQLSPKQLLQQTLVSSGTMTNRIDRLVGRRLVRREADPDDGRSILVILTDDGRVRVDAAITRLVDAEAALLAALSRGDRERLAGLLRKLSLGFDA